MSQIPAGSLEIPPIRTINGTQKSHHTLYIYQQITVYHIYILYQLTLYSDQPNNPDHPSGKHIRKIILPEWRPDCYN